MHTDGFVMADMDKTDLAMKDVDMTNRRDGSTDSELADADIQIDPAKEKKLLAKLDIALTPIIMLVYLSCFLDRSNIG